ncbi:hypothetical protein HHI36_013325 [Cryptolaemus montrouzieri]|uniref:Reverse transcriptase domain-containing protein n=1 Tax=Cryptolaemus montrouzieri TaxID=559131 RepID=A0ABD2NGV2_9CUCU
MRMGYREGVTPVAYVDDLAILIEGMSIEEIQEKLARIYELLTAFMRSRGFEQAHHKTKLGILKGPRSWKTHSLRGWDQQIRQGTADDPAYVLKCARYRSRINEMSELFGERVTPERIMSHLIDKPTKWQKGARIISDIMVAKEIEDKENQREDRNEEED